MRITLVKGRGKYLIEIDKYQYILKKWRTPEDKKPYWENVGYYSTVEGVAKRLFFEGFTSGKEYKNLVEAVRVAQDTILKALMNKEVGNE